MAVPLFYFVGVGRHCVATRAARPHGATPCELDARHTEAKHDEAIEPRTGKSGALLFLVAIVAAVLHWCFINELLSLL